MEVLQLEPNNLEHLSEISRLLKRTFPRKSTELTEEWLVWKYFGSEGLVPSIFLYAVDQRTRKIVGTRGFLASVFVRSDGKTKLLSYQSCDTSVHENYRGQGIFKSLTAEALKLAAERGADFVYNFPNENSLPGYLKMGWEQDTVLLRMIRMPLLFSTSQMKWQAPHLCARYHIEKDDNYLHWRYRRNPTFNYEETRIGSDVVLIHRKGKLSGIRVVWLVDVFPSLDDLFKLDHEEVIDCINSFGKGKVVATMSNVSFTSVKKWEAIGLRAITGGRGVCFVLRKLSEIDVSSNSIEITPGIIDTF